MKLSRTQIEYLLIMDEMMAEGPVRLRDVAQALGVSKPSVHGMEEQFVRLGLIEKQRYAPVHMTEEGLRIAEEYRLQVQALSRCLEKALGLPESEARDSALALLGEWSEEYRGKVFSYLYARQK